jgi:hypothetical protein
MKPSIIIFSFYENLKLTLRVGLPPGVGLDGIGIPSLFQSRSRKFLESRSRSRGRSRSGSGLDKHWIFSIKFSKTCTYTRETFSFSSKFSPAALYITVISSKILPAALYNSFFLMWVKNIQNPALKIEKSKIPIPKSGSRDPEDL